MRQIALKTYRYYDFVMAAFVTVLICSNLIGPAKIVQLDWLPFAFGAGVLFFPISYVFGDILTEVYGYARARRVIWAGFGGLRSPRSWPGWWWRCRRRRSGRTSGLRDRLRHHLAHRARLDVRLLLRRVRELLRAGQDEDPDRRRWLWTRTIGSTIVGEAVDSSLFYPLAFYNSGLIPNEKLPAIMLAQFVAQGRRSRSCSRRSPTRSWGRSSAPSTRTTTTAAPTSPLQPEDMIHR